MTRAARRDLSHPERRTPLISVSAPITLPVEPGTYEFPLAHQHFDRRELNFGVVQRTGRHAIVERAQCNSDFCASILDVGRRTRMRGRALTLELIYAEGRDLDLTPDREERHKLRVVKVEQVRRALRVTITNPGPDRADIPRVLVVPALVAHCPKIREPGSVGPPRGCLLNPLKPGQTRTLQIPLVSDQPVRHATKAQAESGTMRPCFAPGGVPHQESSYLVPRRASRRCATGSRMARWTRLIWPNDHPSPTTWSSAKSTSATPQAR